VLDGLGGDPGLKVRDGFGRMVPLSSGQVKPVLFGSRAAVSRRGEPLRRKVVTRAAGIRWSWHFVGGKGPTFLEAGGIPFVGPLVACRGPFP